VKRLVYSGLLAVGLLVLPTPLVCEEQASPPNLRSQLPQDSAGSLSPRERDYLLRLARAALSQYLESDTRIHPKEKDLTPALKENRACFVTLTKAGSLRGCIGYLAPTKPLCDCVIENAIAAGVGDPRFPKAVTTEELKELKIEVSALTIPQRLVVQRPDELPAMLVPGRDGVILRKGSRQATYLPQVWEHLPERESFLDSLCQKALLPGGCWRDPDTEVLVYQAEAFKE
jgi:uncharacterized protein